MYLGYAHTGRPVGLLESTVKQFKLQKNGVAKAVVAGALDFFVFVIVLHGLDHLDMVYTGCLHLLQTLTSPESCSELVLLPTHFIHHLLQRTYCCSRWTYCLTFYTDMMHIRWARLSFLG